MPPAIRQLRPTVNEHHQRTVFRPVFYIERRVAVGFDHPIDWHIQNSCQYESEIGSGNSDNEILARLRQSSLASQ